MDRPYLCGIVAAVCLACMWLPTETGRATAQVDPLRPSSIEAVDPPAADAAMGPGCCKGDTNLDGTVNGGDIRDFTRVLLNGATSSEEFCACDLNDDSSITEYDLELFPQMLVDGVLFCQ